MKSRWILLAAVPLAHGSPIASPSIVAEIPKTALAAFVEKPVTKDSPTRPEVTFSAMRYGPYPVKAKSMLESELQSDVAKPCVDCYITAMEADLQYEDGRSANIDEGAWLHHFILYNGLGFTPANSKKDLVCSGTMMSLGGGYPHRIFASGNERGAVRLNTKYLYGMQVDKDDKFFLLYDILNQSPRDHVYYVVMKFEWVPKSTPGYKAARMVWLDISGCTDSNMPGRIGHYEYKSPGWKSNIGGRMLASVGHMHDGGTETTIYINEKPICTSQQLYGTKEAWIEKGDIVNLSDPNADLGTMPSGHGHKMKRAANTTDSTMLHISEASSCVDFGVLKVGDVIKVGATYNSTAHKLNLPYHGHDKGLWAAEKLAPVMGINPVYVAEGFY